MTQQATAEHARLEEDRRREANWQRWGPYLSERQWGTVREDYSPNGDAWRDFTHEQSRSRVYRWGEDGLLGLTDRQCRLCFSVALWNGQDDILKERLFGLTGPEGNHGEDVKEIYYYLDATPTYSYAKALYRYPQSAFPYQRLVEENAKRGLLDREFELIDSGVFQENRFFDVTAEYAKGSPNDVLVRIRVTNHGPDSRPVWVLPTLWFRNTWVWGCRHEGCSMKPRIFSESLHSVSTAHETLDPMACHFADSDGFQELIFTENETNSELLFNVPNFSPYVKDAFHRYVIHGEETAVQPKRFGTKVAGVYHWELGSGESCEVLVRLTADDSIAGEPFGNAFEECFALRKTEADAFYDRVIPAAATTDQRLVSRQAYAGLLWTKQFYHYIVDDWLTGDRDVAQPPAQRKTGRNARWTHLYARDVLSMPDKWEYPWFAAWDLAFHMIPMARIDPEFAKNQLLVLLREWYMHPNGQMPAYEYGFCDVNPPVHAWACLKVFQISAEAGQPDYDFLAKAFQRLLMNFTWWVNQVDRHGDNVFAGGFLGLDNIGVFDRTRARDTPGLDLQQADGTSWMAFYCLKMLSIALELSRKDKSYSSIASKFLDHFVRITDAIATHGGTGLWHEEDEFYYDHLNLEGRDLALRVRSLVGLIPLIAVEVLDQDLVDQLPAFRNRLEWFLKYRHDLVRHIGRRNTPDGKWRLLLSIPSPERLSRVISVLLDEAEFLSPYGIRSLSKFHEDNPFELNLLGETHRVAYVPGESDSWMFGGNSNWRGPIWFPLNFLLTEALERYHEYYGDQLQVACPTGSTQSTSLLGASAEINRRLTRLFLANENGESIRPCIQADCGSPQDPLWHDHLLFHEYFHPETGRGLGASHQTGWTALIATCLEKQIQSEGQRG